jgi:hypothetical protein
MNNEALKKLLKHYAKARKHIYEASVIMHETINGDDKNPIVPLLTGMAERHGDITVDMFNNYHLLNTYQICLSTDPYLFENYHRMSREEIAKHCEEKMAAMGQAVKDSK